MWVLGGREGIGRVFAWGPLKGAQGNCLEFEGVGKSHKMRKKSREVALFFGIRVIEDTDAEISRT